MTVPLGSFQKLKSAKWEHFGHIQEEHNAWILLALFCLYQYNIYARYLQDDTTLATEILKNRNENDVHTAASSFSFSAKYLSVWVIASVLLLRIIHLQKLRAPHYRNIYDASEQPAVQ